MYYTEQLSGWRPGQDGGNWNGWQRKQMAGITAETYFFMQTGRWEWEEGKADDMVSEMMFWKNKTTKYKNHY